jgi:hypothetical protein
MIEELKREVEQTLGRKVLKRGDCELLADDLYQKTGTVVSYNTFRRLFGIIEYRKPRESTLDALSVYIGFESFQDFTKRFSEVDTWPVWEHLYVMLSEGNSNEILRYLYYRKRQQDQFTIAFKDSGVTLENEKGYIHWDWIQFSHYFESPHFFHLYFSSKSFFMVPKDRKSVV